MVNLTPAIPTFVITLREGVEAALVVGIVLAYLRKAEKTHLNSWVYTGVAGGLLASVLVGILFGGLLQAIGSSDQTYAPVLKQALEGTFGLAAIVMLSWMLIWMTQQARGLKAQVEGAVGDTLAGEAGAGWGIGGLIFFAVLREGFETVLFIAAKFQQGGVPILGAIAGLLTAIGIGVLLFRLGVRINLRQFFQVMGIFLVLIVAGLVVSSLAHFDRANTLLAQIQGSELLCPLGTNAPSSSCLLGTMVWDLTRILPERQFPGIVLHTLFGYEDQLYLVQAVSYLAFLLAIGGLYLRSLSGWGTSAAQSSRAEPSN